MSKVAPVRFPPLCKGIVHSSNRWIPVFCPYPFHVCGQGSHPSPHNRATVLEPACHKIGLARLCRSPRQTSANVLNNPPIETHNSPSLVANFPSNNPFRNRATSPASYHSLPSPQTATFNIPNTDPERPTSRNPFLDQNPRPRAASPPQIMPEPRERMSPSKPAFTGHTAELFVCQNRLFFEPPLSAGICLPSLDR